MVYTANWGIICYLPPFKGTRNNQWEWIRCRSVGLPVFLLRSKFYRQLCGSSTIRVVWRLENEVAVSPLKNEDMERLVIPGQFCWWPFGGCFSDPLKRLSMVKWPPTRGWKVHFASPGKTSFLLKNGPLFKGTCVSFQGCRSFERNKTCNVLIRKVASEPEKVGGLNFYKKLQVKHRQKIITIHLKNQDLPYKWIQDGFSTTKKG